MILLGTAHVNLTRRAREGGGLPKFITPQRTLPQSAPTNNQGDLPCQKSAGIQYNSAFVNFKYYFVAQVNFLESTVTLCSQFRRKYNFVGGKSTTPVWPNRK